MNSKFLSGATILILSAAVLIMVLRHTGIHPGQPAQPPTQLQIFIASPSAIAGIVVDETGRSTSEPSGQMVLKLPSGNTLPITITNGSYTYSTLDYSTPYCLTAVSTVAPTRTFYGFIDTLNTGADTVNIIYNSTATTPTLELLLLNHAKGKVTQTINAILTEADNGVQTIANSVADNASTPPCAYIKFPGIVAGKSYSFTFPYTNSSGTHTVTKSFTAPAAFGSLSTIGYTFFVD